MQLFPFRSFLHQFFPHLSMSNFNFSDSSVAAFMSGGLLTLTFDFISHCLLSLLCLSLSSRKVGLGGLARGRILNSRNEEALLLLYNYACTCSHNTILYMGLNNSCRNPIGNVESIILDLQVSQSFSMWPSHNNGKSSTNTHKSSHHTLIFTTELSPLLVTTWDLGGRGGGSEL